MPFPNMLPLLGYGNYYQIPIIFFMDLNINCLLIGEPLKRYCIIKTLLFNFFISLKKLFIFIFENQIIYYM